MREKQRRDNEERRKAFAAKAAAEQRASGDVMMFAPNERRPGRSG
jgi:hypothetical protein